MTTRTTRYTTCPYNCWPVNCGLRVTTEGGRVVELDGNPHHDLSRGMLCVKGASAGEIVGSPGRLLQPLIRDGRRGSGHWQTVGWDEALGRIASRLRANIDAGRREANALYHSHGNIVQRVNWKILTPRFANLVGFRAFGRSLYDEQLKDGGFEGIATYEMCARLRGGEVHFQGTPGQGTTVMVRLPPANRTTS